MKRQNIIEIAFITFTFMFAGIAGADQSSTNYSYFEYDKHDGHDENDRHDDQKQFEWYENTRTNFEFDADDVSRHKHQDMELKWNNESGSDHDVKAWKPSHHWKEIKKHGEWADKIGWENHDSDKGHHHDIHAAVAPEPVSSVLFLSGGLIMAGRRYMRRNSTH